MKNSFLAVLLTCCCVSFLINCKKDSGTGNGSGVNSKPSYNNFNLTFTVNGIAYSPSTIVCGIGQNMIYIAGAGGIRAKGIAINFPVFKGIYSISSSNYFSYTDSAQGTVSNYYNSPGNLCSVNVTESDI